MVKDELSACLEACCELSYELIQIRCEAFDAFRKTAWLIMRDPQCQWSPQCEAIRRKLWRAVFSLSCVPSRWQGELTELLGIGQNEFTTIVKQIFGEEQATNAETLVRLWDTMSSRFDNEGPIGSVLTTAIGSMRDDLVDFRIVSQKKHHIGYSKILTNLELDEANICCTPSMVKHESPFDCLITCGPFRQDDFLFTSPRYKKILNIRWEGDTDFSDFPNFIAGRNRTDEEEKFPPDFPAIVFEQKSVVEFEFPVVASKEIQESGWSYHEFEQIYIPRRKRVSRILRANRGHDASAEDNRDRSQTPSDREVHYSKLTFFNESYLIESFDQQGKPRLQLSIDPESDLKIKKRRPGFGSDDDFLHPGMLVIVEPHASERLSKAASDDQSYAPVHLPKWKQKLREHVNSLRRQNQSIKFKMQLVGLSEKYSDIENAVNRWCSHGMQPPEAPGDFDCFKRLVCDFLEYEEWELAWDEVEFIRGSNKGIGISRESNIDRYLVESVKNRINEVLGNQVTRLPVKGFDSDVIIIELDDFHFLNEEQIHKSEVNKIIGLDEEQTL